MRGSRLFGIFIGLSLCLSIASNAHASDIRKDGIRALSMSGDCRFVLGQTSRDHFVVLDSATLEQISPTIELNDVQAETLNDDGSRLALSDDRAKLRIFETKSGKLILSTVIPVPLRPRTSGFLRVHLLSYSHDGQEIVAVTDEVVVILNAITGKEIARVNSPDIWSFAFKWAQLSPDKSQLLTAYGYRHPPGLWDAHTGKLLRTLDDPAGRRVTSNSVCLSPDGKLVATGEDVLDKATKIDISLVRVRECRSGRIVLESEFEAEVHALAFSRDVKQLAAAARQTRVFDVTTFKPVTKMLRNNFFDEVSEVAFSPNGKYVMSNAPTGFTMVWEVRTQKLVLKERDGDLIPFAAFARVGHVLIISEDSGPGPDFGPAVYAWKLPE